MKKLYWKVHRLIFRRTYNKLEKIITNLIRNSEGKIEGIKNYSNDERLNSGWGKYIFRMYDSPPKCPDSIREVLNKYSSGMNWEYFWSKASFYFLSKLPLESYTGKLKNIIEGRHIWYSYDALEALCTVKGFFEYKDNVSFIREFLKKEKTWSSIAYIKILGRLNALGINKILEELLAEKIKLETGQSYLQAFYIIKGLIEEGNQIGLNNSIYLLDVAKSDNFEVIEKYGSNFQFTKQLRARSLIQYIDINLIGKEALEFLENWIDKENDKEVKNILRKTADNNS